MTIFASPSMLLQRRAQKRFNLPITDCERTQVLTSWCLTQDISLRRSCRFRRIALYIKLVKVSSGKASSFASKKRPTVRDGAGALQCLSWGLYKHVVGACNHMHG